MSYLPAFSSVEYGLSAPDFLTLTVLATTLGAGWLLVIECGDGPESYARLVSPWNKPRDSAFLIEREAGVVILTDRLSNLTDDNIKLYPRMHDALDAIHETIDGRLPGDSRVGNDCPDAGHQGAERPI